MSKHVTIDMLERTVISMYKNNLRTIAHLRALESMVRDVVPSDKREAWDNALAARSIGILNELLATEADRDAAWAAKLSAAGEITGR